MIRLLLIVAFLWPLSLFALNEEVMLDAIAAVETGNRDLVGKAHERGPWQLLPSVAARVGGHDRKAAHKWLKIIMRDLVRRGVFVSPHSVALSWNAGVHAAAGGRAPESSYLYSIRVVNVYESRLIRALGRPQSKALTPRFSLTPPMFIIPSTP